MCQLGSRCDRCTGVTRSCLSCWLGCCAATSLLPRRCVDCESECSVDHLPLGLGDRLLRASRDADQFAVHAEVLDRCGATVAMLTRWMVVNAMYCADDPAHADLSIVATAEGLVPRVYDAFAEVSELGHSPQARNAWWQRSRPISTSPCRS